MLSSKIFEDHPKAVVSLSCVYEVYEWVVYEGVYLFISLGASLLLYIRSYIAGVSKLRPAGEMWHAVQLVLARMKF